MAAPFSLSILDSELHVHCARTDQRLVIGRTADPPLRVSVVEGRGETGRHMPLQAVFGVYWLLSGPYLAVVTDAKRECAAPLGGSILKVSRTMLVPVFSHGRVLSPEQRDDETRLLAMIREVFDSHEFFFSFDADVTHTAQRAATFSDEAAQQTLAQRADERFFWNRGALQELVAAEAWDWVVPMMSAFVEAVEGMTVADRPPFTFVLISRRSCRRQGTRFTRRGIDADGNVANFVETEQAAVFGDGAVSSFVQIRGSIPLVWASPVTLKYAPRVQLAEARVSQRPFNLHVEDLLARYESVLCINLIDGKKDQGRLGNAFQEAATAFGNADRFSLDWFDFHKECKKGGWSRLNVLVRRVDEEFQRMGFFEINGSGVVTRRQVGVQRTNCMDNLDRTNVVQSLLARRSLLHQLGQTEALMGDVLTSPFPELEKTFKNVWADHADTISLLYSGTGALKTDFTRTGVRTKAGILKDGVNSVTRYYLNNLRDGDRQDAIDLFLGVYRPTLPKYVSPRGAVAGQETGMGVLVKMAVLFVALVVLAGKPLTDVGGSAALLAAFLAILLVVAYVLVKKGAAYGKRCVSVPRFKPELMNTVRS